MLRYLSVVALATALSVQAGFAQSSLDLRGPAELPPASFKGQQYIDSRGCAFLRAGYGGQVTWVPRVTRDRKQICGGAPSGGTVAVAEAEAPVVAAPAPKPVPAPVPRAVAAKPAPAPTVVAAAPTAPAKVRQAPARVARSQTVTEAAAVAAPAAPGGRLYCPAETPVAQRFAVHGGGTKLLCVRGDGSMTGANFPRLADGRAVVDGRVVTTRSDGTTVTVIHAPAKGNPAKMPPIPEGYVRAWDDDRLNINRGRRTAAGEIAQDEVWTRTVPADLREDSTVKRKKLVIIVRPSSKGEGAGGQGSYVQVGSFGQPGNADKAAATLKALGLPVARSKVKRGGSVLQVVYAGPFASASDARAALAAAQGAGFADAILR